MVNIYMGDLSHKFQKHITFPYNVGLVASYAKKELGDQINIEIFKDFERLMERISEKKPDVLALTNYMWNSQLSLQTLKLVKSEFPEMIATIGGANYHNDRELQEKFMSENPAVDFAVFKEGEAAFTGLMKTLIDARLDAKAIKSEKKEIPSVHYLSGDDFILGENVPRLRELDDIPSPYLTGMLDPFFEKDLSVLIQRTRGCPFSCTFCMEGTAYYNKVRKFSAKRFAEEFLYCAERLAGKSGRRSLFHIADANFGMFPDDIEVATSISEIRKEYLWPRKIEVPTGKNKRDRVLKVVNLINEHSEDAVIRLTASVQSTDNVVLQNIKRSNISVGDLIAGATSEQSETDRSYPYGEVILALSGDSTEAHKQTIRDLIEDGITKISHQYLTILPGTEMDTLKSRKTFGCKTAFRIMPGAYGHYHWKGKDLQWFETEERAIGNKSMTLDNYLTCLEYDLTVESFYNDGLFDEFIGFLKFLKIPVSGFIDAVFGLRDEFPPEADLIYKNFIKGRKEELSDNRDEMIAKAIENPNAIEDLLSHENKISLATCKAHLIFGHMDLIHSLAHQAMMDCLQKAEKYNDTNREYFEEASKNSYARKSSLLDDSIVKQTLKFDFVGIQKDGFKDDPYQYYYPEGIEHVYSPHQKIKEKNDYLLTTEPDQLLRWRKLLFEPRIDCNDEFCRVINSEKGGIRGTKSVESTPPSKSTRIVNQLLAGNRSSSGVG